MQNIAYTGQCRASSMRRQTHKSFRQNRQSCRFERQESGAYQSTWNPPTLVAWSSQQAAHVYTIRPARYHNRQLHKAAILKGGVRKANQAKKYVCGFRLYDKVLYNGVECFVWGRRTSGSFLLRGLCGAKVKDDVSYKHLKLLERSQNYLIA